MDRALKDTIDTPLFSYKCQKRRLYAHRMAFEFVLDRRSRSDSPMHPD